MRYWAFLRNTLFGPFARDEMLMLPGFTDATPVCPAETVDGVREWTPAVQIPEFKEIFLDAAAPDDGPGAAAFKGAALQKALALGVPPTAFMISESRKRILDLETALRREFEDRARRDEEFGQLLQSIQDLAGGMNAALEKFDGFQEALSRIAESVEKQASAPPPPFVTVIS